MLNAPRPSHRAACTPHRERLRGIAITFELARSPDRRSGNRTHFPAWGGVGYFASALLARQMHARHVVPGSNRAEYEGTERKSRGIH
jgi:hypothetical protein